MNEKQKTVVLGLIFLFFLVLAYVENTFFFSYLTSVFSKSSPVLAVAVVFVHNVLVVSLILLSMTFYVNLVLTFFPKRKHNYIVLEHPRIFALVFTVMILVLSIFRASTLVYGRVEIGMLGWILLISTPNGLIEGYGIFLTLKKTFKRNMRMKDLAFIYSLFFAAAVLEVSFIQLLCSISAK
ncbi:MAG: hypothetical protein U9O89_05495 [Thermoproteota archaeon]|nr:hypothetical protein [Thermoproteota archaeon]